MRLSPAEYRFCPTASCRVVYFALASLYHCEDLTVPVFQKEAAGNRTVCYCFDTTETDVRCEIQGSTSAASARITALVKAGRCACEVRNPQGTCCLGNVNAVEASSVEVVPASAT